MAQTDGKMLNTSMTMTDFVKYLSTDLPNFVKHCERSNVQAFDALSLLAEHAFCGEHAQFKGSETEMDDPLLEEYLHTLHLVVKVNRARIEGLFGDI